jgi:hypothetical protein
MTDSEVLEITKDYLWNGIDNNYADQSNKSQYVCIAVCMAMEDEHVSDENGTRVITAISKLLGGWPSVKMWLRAEHSIDASILPKWVLQDYRLRWINHMQKNGILV